MFRGIQNKGKTTEKADHHNNSAFGRHCGTAQGLRFSHLLSSFSFGFSLLCLKPRFNGGTNCAVPWARESTDGTGGLTVGYLEAPRAKELINLIHPWLTMSVPLGTAESMLPLHGAKRKPLLLLSHPCVHDSEWKWMFRIDWRVSHFDQGRLNNDLLVQHGGGSLTPIYSYTAFVPTPHMYMIYMYIYINWST